MSQQPPTTTITTSDEAEVKLILDHRTKVEAQRIHERNQALMEGSRVLASVPIDLREYDRRGHHLQLRENGEATVFFLTLSYQENYAGMYENARWSRHDRVLTVHDTLEDAREAINQRLADAGTELRVGEVKTLVVS